MAHGRVGQAMWVGPQHGRTRAPGHSVAFRSIAALSRVRLVVGAHRKQTGVARAVLVRPCPHCC